MFFVVFYENVPEYHIVCAGSLLGIVLHEETLFPVGRVDFLKLYPMSFKEFLMAIALDRFAELLDKKDYETAIMRLSDCGKSRLGSLLYQ